MVMAYDHQLLMIYTVFINHLQSITKHWLQLRTQLLYKV